MPNGLQRRHSAKPAETWTAPRLAERVQEFVQLATAHERLQAVTTSVRATV